MTGIQNMTQTGGYTAFFRLVYSTLVTISLYEPLPNVKYGYDYVQLWVE